MRPPPFDPLAEARQQRQAQRLHNLGVCPMLHAIREIALGADMDAVLHRYAALDPDFVRSMGGDRFASPMLLVVGEHAA